MNPESFELWKLTSSQHTQRRNFFSCSNSPILDSNRAVPLLRSPPPLHPKLGLTNLIVNSLFTPNLNLEEQFTYQLGNARKEYHGKSFEGRQCSKCLSCSPFLKEVVLSSVRLLVECLEALHCVVIGVFGQIIAIFKKQIDILYSVFRILHSSDSWAWINPQEDFENAQYLPLHGLKCTTCLVHTNSHPRFFCENVNEIVSRSAGQYSAHIEGRNKHLFMETVG